MKLLFGGAARKYIQYIILILIGITFIYPLFLNMNYTGVGDWDYFCFSNEVSRETILRYKQFPFWNPFASGGLPLHANPQSAFLSPAFLLSLIFGCAVGFKLEILVSVILGMIGMFLLSNYYKLHPAAGIFASAIFGLSSFFSLHISEGHLTFLGFYLVPYIFLFYLKSFEQKRYMFLAGVFITLVVFAGGSFNVLPQLSIFLFAYGIFSSIQKRPFKPFLILIVIFLIAFCLGSIKTIPTLEYLTGHPRLIQSDEKTTIKGLYNVFLNRQRFDGIDFFETQKWGWYEYGAYTGIFPLIFFAFGLVFFIKKEAPLVLSGLFALFVSLGDFGKFSPWYLLHKLPLFESLHVPSRYIILFIFSLAIVAGLSFNLFVKELKNKKAKYFLFALLLFIVADLVVVNSKPFERTFLNPLPPIVKDVDFKQIYGVVVPPPPDSGIMYLNFLANRGTLSSYESVPHQTFAKDSNNPDDYKGEVYLEGNGTASYAYWSPNKLVVNVVAQNVTRLIINQNYDTGWRVKDKVAENFNGLLSTMVAPSDKIVEFYYFPRPFIIGLMVTAVSIILMILFLWKSAINF